MAILYRVYRNDGAGGPVDYTTTMAVVPGISCDLGALAAPGDHSFAVRAYDSETGLGEFNTEAVTRIRLDENGRDVTSVPNPPHALQARPMAAGRCAVSWAYSSAGAWGNPIGFHVYLGVGPTPDYSQPVATVSHLTRSLGYTTTISGLTDGQNYSIAVRAFNETGEEQNDRTFEVIGLGSILNAVDSLTAVPILDR